MIFKKIQGKKEQNLEKMQGKSDTVVTPEENPSNQKAHSK